MLFVSNSTYAQHNHDTTDRSVPLQFAPVLNTFLSDPDLKKFQLQSSLMTVPPSLVDTVSHRHDADLFGYVIKGKIVVALEGEGAKTFMAGQMFHETKNILHTRLENLNSKATAEVLLIFIIKKGASSYIKE